MSDTVLSPSFTILYNNKDITNDVSEHLIALTYTDKVDGECDELELQFEDAQGLWRDAWYPEKGATLQVEIRHAGKRLDCGVFEIDEPVISGSRSGDVMTIRGLAAGITTKLRTKRSSAHENKTLAEIARTIAAKHGMTVQGITKDVTLSRATQNRKTDLGFLSKLAADYGYVFSVRDKVMVFTQIYDLEQAASATAVDYTDLLEYSIKDKSFQTYRAANVRYNNPVDGTTVTGSSSIETEGVTADDTLEIRTKAENQQQAEEKAKSALYRANTRQQEGNISMPGNPAIIAGNNFDLTGMGQLSGKYHIIQSTHRIDKAGGYVTDAEIKRLIPFTDQRKKPKSVPELKTQPPTIGRVPAPAAPLAQPNFF